MHKYDVVESSGTRFLSYKGKTIMYDQRRIGSDELFVIVPGFVKDRKAVERTLSKAEKGVIEREEPPSPAFKGTIPIEVSFFEDKEEMKELSEIIEEETEGSAKSINFFLETEEGKVEVWEVSKNID